MKKINFQKFENEDLFSKLKSQKLDSLTSEALRGGQTSTALCKTHEPFGDVDSSSSQENVADPRCATGY